MNEKTRVEIEAALDDFARIAGVAMLAMRAVVSDASYGQLKRMLEAAEALGRDNCWWVLYDMRDLVREVVATEARNREPAP